MDTSMKALYKYELADIAGVSRRTLLKWINSLVVAEHPAFVNYNKHCKILTPVQVDALSNKYCVVFEK